MLQDILYRLGSLPPGLCVQTRIPYLALNLLQYKGQICAEVANGNTPQRLGGNCLDIF